MEDGTTSPEQTNVPDWLKELEAFPTPQKAPIFQSETQFKSTPEYKMVDLYDIPFLGRHVVEASYVEWPDGLSGDPGPTHKVRGVAKEFAKELLAAQRRIFRSFSAQASDPATITRDRFVAWCGVGGINGYQFRGGRHAAGVAMDIDSGDNPYTAVGTVGGSCGGEKHKGISDAEHKAYMAEAVNVYDRACQLVLGEPLGDKMSGSRTKDPTAAVWDDLSKVSHAVATYFQLAFITAKTNKLVDGTAQAPLPRGLSDEDPGCFTKQFESFSGSGFLKGASVWKGREKDLFDQIRSDMPKLRIAMVYDSLKKGAPGIGGTGFVARSGTRDPCHGFLTIRKEVAVGLRAPGTHMVWGACDWGSAPGGSGDMMHFDIRNPGATSPDTHPNKGTVCYLKPGHKDFN